MSNSSTLDMCWVETGSMPYSLPFDDAEFDASKTTNATCPNTIDNVYSRRIELEKKSDAIGNFIEYTVIVKWNSGRQERDVTISGEIRERST
jgi:hypothetical protein